MSTRTASAKHELVFAVLMVFALLSVAVSFLHLPGTMNNGVIFTIAFVMAALVVLQYMGLKWEGALIYTLFIVPVVLFVILVLSLVPDFVWNHTILPGGH